MKKTVANAELSPSRVLLLVEDDVLIAQNQSRLLEKAGYRVHAVHSAEKAISSIVQGSEPWDMVLMDIDLGQGKDGPDTAREMLALRNLPILFLSAHSEDEYINRTIGIESYGFIAKNAGSAILLASIAMAFRLWDARQKQHSEERQYRVLVESSPDVIMRLDRHHHYLYVSPSVHFLGGRKPLDFEGKTVSDMGDPPEQVTRWTDSLDNVFVTGEAIEQEIRQQVGNRLLDLNWRLVPERDDDGRVVSVLSILRDISTQKKAETYRYQNELRMAFLLELYAHAQALSEEEIGERAVRMAREISSSSDGFLHFVGNEDEKAPEEPRLRECLETRAPVIFNELDAANPGNTRSILVPVLDHDRVVMILVVSGKKFPYDDTDRAQLQLAANEINRILARKRADEELQESYSQYQSILNTASDGFYMTDKDGRFLDVNEVYLHMLGYRRSELLKMKVSDLEMVLRTDKGEMHRRQVIARGKDVREDVHQHKSGHAVALEITTTYISSSHRFVSFVRDIGASKKAEENLSRMQHLLSETGRIARIGGWEYDLETTHMSWTDEIFRIHDLSLDFVPTLDRAFAFLEGESLTVFSEAFKKLVQTREPFVLELSLRSATGRIKWVRAMCTPMMRNDKLVGVAGTLQDITDQKRTVTEARETSTRLDRFFLISIDLFSILDAEGRFVSLNPAWETVLNYPLAELKARRFIDYVHPDDAAETMQVWKDAQDMPISGFINRYRTRDGYYRWLEWRTSPSDDRTQVFCAAHDITEWRRNTMALHRQASCAESLLALYRRHSSTRQKLIEEVLESAMTLSSSSLGYLHIVDGQEKIVDSCFWSKGVDTGSAMQQSLVVGLGHQMEGGGIWADSFRIRRPVIHNDFQSIPDRGGYPPGHVAIDRHLGIPFIVDGKVRLILGVANKKNSYEDEDAAQLLAFLDGAWRLIIELSDHSS